MPDPGGAGPAIRSGFECIQFGHVGALSTNQTRFMVPFSNGGVSVTEAAAQWPASRAGVLSRLRVHAGAAPTLTATIVYVVRVNGVPMALTCSQALADGPNVADLLHTVTVAIGDLVSLAAITTGAGVFPGAAFASMEFN